MKYERDLHRKNIWNPEMEQGRQLGEVVRVKIKFDTGDNILKKM